MDKRTVLAVVISLTIWLGWQKYYWEPHQKAQREWAQYQKQQQERAATKAGSVASAGAEVDKPASTPAARKSESEKASAKAAPSLVREVALGGQKLRFTNSPALFGGWSLPEFKTSDEDQVKRREIDLKYVTGFDSQLRIAFSDAVKSEQANQNYTSATTLPTGALYADSLRTESFLIQREVYADSVEHTLRLDLDFRFFGAEVPAYVFLEFFGNPKREHDKPGSIFGEFPDKVDISFWNKEGTHIHVADQVQEKFETKAGAYWLGLNTRYFLFAAVPQDKEIGERLGVQLQPGIFAGAPALEGKLVIPTEGKRELKLPLRVYFGPKRLETLEAVSPTLRHAIDFGWTSAIAIPLLKMLQWVYSFAHNYGIAIIVVTLFVKILLFPLTYKSMKSMAQLSKLRPQMERIQKKYADDKQKLQQEIWALYKSNGANPLSGCLPLLIQMPVFFALYRVLFNSMELYQAPFGLWIHDLSAKDPFFVTPILLTALMYLQQRLTPATNADPSQQAVMRIMPVMFGVFMLFLPSGLNIYMLVNTIVSIGQQYVLNRKFGLHNAPASPTDASGAVAKPT